MYDKHIYLWVVCAWLVDFTHLFTVQPNHDRIDFFLWSTQKESFLGSQAIILAPSFLSSPDWAFVPLFFFFLLWSIGQLLMINDRKNLIWEAKFSFPTELQERWKNFSGRVPHIRNCACNLNIPNFNFAWSCFQIHDDDGQSVTFYVVGRSSSTHISFKPNSRLLFFVETWMC